MQESSTTILELFERINAIPRCSKNEMRLGQWLHAWAQGHGFSTRKDAAGNLLVRVPAAPGQEHRPTVVLQGHMDMVCEKTPDSSHDFNCDPIVSNRQGDWLTADSTTLGADNGIAIAYAMALAEDQSISRPALELLFTVDEETGLNGVKAMAPDLIRGRILINLDSEDEGIFTIGCAGGMDTTLTLDLQGQPAPADSLTLNVIVGGSKGGHSGIDIHKPRANANKILARTLAQVSRTADYRLAAMTGGSRHNAIPRDAEALIALGRNDKDAVEDAVKAMHDLVRREYGAHEPQLFVKTALSTAPPIARYLSRSDTARATRLLQSLPHGVAHFSSSIEGLVETSSNLATVRLQDGRMQILLSQRSSVASRLEELNATIHAVAELAGAACQDENKYPAWQPNMDNPLLHQSIQVYRTLFGKKPKIQVIHAGLECAIIAALYPGMQMISFGPTIRNAHSPQERVFVPSVGQVWRLLVGLLESLGR